MISCSLPAAIRLPVNVRPPRMTSAASAPVRNGVRSCPLPDTPRKYSAVPTSAAARPPNACESAVRCGTAVSGTFDSGTPIKVPTIIATTIHV